MGTYSTTGGRGEDRNNHHHRRRHTRPDHPPKLASTRVTIDYGYSFLRGCTRRILAARGNGLLRRGNTRVWTCREFTGAGALKLRGQMVLLLSTVFSLFSSLFLTSKRWKCLLRRMYITHRQWKITEARITTRVMELQAA